MRSFLMEQLKRFGPRELLVSPLPEPAPAHIRERITYDDVYRRSLELAGWLREQGVGFGTRVAIGGGNSTRWVIAFVAVNFAGGVPILLNATMQPEMQVHCLTLTSPSLVLLDEKMAEALGPLRDVLREKGVPEMYCWSSVSHLPSAAQAGVKELHFTPSPAAMRDVESGKGLEAMHPESDGIIMFTSGTTSHPKAVLVTQRGAMSHVISAAVPGARAALRAGADLATALAKHDPPAKQATMLVPVPLFHITGCLSWLVKAITYGNKVVFMRRWNVGDAVKLIIEEKIALIGGVPAIATAVLQSNLIPDSHEIASITYGGAPPPVSLAKDLLARWPKATLGNAYGMTETNGIFTGIVGQDYIDKPTTVGPAFPVTDVRIVDPETRQDLPQGETGLILARGCMLMKCYVNNPEATRKAVDADGWFDTGDLASMDEEGWIHIRDRAKDMIIRGGENIASLEVEHAVCHDPRVEYAAAVPVPCPVMGERVGIAVTLAPGASATAQSIIAEASPRLRHAARPVVAVVIPEIPRNANGKVLKNEVRKIVGDVWKVQNAAKEAPKARL